MNCCTCCHETEMELSNEDVEKISVLGYTGFYHMENGYKVLNNIDDRCFFLENGRCKIYKHKPKGCDIYPQVMALPSRIPKMDRDCPHRKLFKFNQEEIEELSELIDRLEVERE